MDEVAGLPVQHRKDKKNLLRCCGPNVPVNYQGGPNVGTQPWNSCCRSKGLLPGAPLKDFGVGWRGWGRSMGLEAAGGHDVANCRRSVFDSCRRTLPSCCRVSRFWRSVAATLMASVA